jgi:hypothetical protein
MKIVCQCCGHINPHNSPVERFWNYVDKSGECWVWMGPINEWGYGTTKGHRGTLAHRIAYEMANGFIPKGMVVCHKCDNPACVRHDHLFLGTDADNTRDKVSKGRHPRGATSGTAKLTEAQVKDILAEFVPGKTTYAALGRKYGVGYLAIRDIILGASWKDIPR